MLHIIWFKTVTRRLLTQMHPHPLTAVIPDAVALLTESGRQQEAGPTAVLQHRDRALTNPLLTKEKIHVQHYEEPRK